MPANAQFVLGLITIVPWGVLLVFDAALYLYHWLLYEFPVVGGRARGQQRPRAPSFNEGPVRILGLSGIDDANDEEVKGEEGLHAEGKEEDIDHRYEKENLSPGPQVVADGEVKRRLSSRSS